MPTTPDYYVSDYDEESGKVTYWRANEFAVEGQPSTVSWRNFAKTLLEGATAQVVNLNQYGEVTERGGMVVVRMMGEGNEFSWDNLSSL